MAKKTKPLTSVQNVVIRLPSGKDMQQCRHGIFLRSNKLLKTVLEQICWERSTPDTHKLQEVDLSEGGVRLRTGIANLTEYLVEVSLGGRCR